MKLFANVSTLSDCRKIQSDLDSLVNWCVVNGIVINISKCCIISYSRCLNHIIYNYNIDKILINRNFEYKDLGVIFDVKLTFNSHIDYITSRAYSMIGFIKRNSREFNDPFTFKTLYVSFVRSIFEYCSII